MNIFLFHDIHFFEIQILKYQVITITPSRERLDNMQRKNLGFLGYTRHTECPQQKVGFAFGAHLRQAMFLEFPFQ